MEPTHASFFSGVGGLDIGLERAGWRTVSFSEIDPYASAVLAQRWPEVPNLGCIHTVAGAPVHAHGSDLRCDLRTADGVGRIGVRSDGSAMAADWQSATLWAGGPPCQDFSVAGKRRGLAGERSALALSWLDLVGRHRPPAVLLENVPGLLSSHAGRDLGTLLGRLGELGYGWAYRVLDARHFGVPQRRRRVFIVALHARVDPSGERAAEVLSVGSRCDRHPPTGGEAGEEPAARVGVGISHALSVSNTTGRLDSNGETFVPGGVRAADGLAGRVDDRGLLADEGIVQALDAKRGGADDNEAQAGHLIAFNPYRTLERDGSVTSGYAERPVVDALHGPTGNKEPLMVVPPSVTIDPLLPDGLDSHRYRCCGNGVVSSVSEWIGRQLLAAIEAAA